MDLQQAIERVLELYPRVFFALHTRHLRDRETGQVLSEHQAGILDHLDPTEARSLKELAAHLGVTPGTMSVAVDRLERLGYLSRDADPEDRRRVRLSLTPAGARLRESRSVLDPERVRRSLEKLTDEELATVLEGLRLLVEASSAGERK